MVVFVLLMVWLVYVFGWYYVFIVMGVIGIVMVVVWKVFVYELKDYLGVNCVEIEYIEVGGGLVNMDCVGVVKVEGLKFGYVK